MKTVNEVINYAGQMVLGHIMSHRDAIYHTSLLAGSDFIDTTLICAWARIKALAENNMEIDVISVCNNAKTITEIEAMELVEVAATKPYSIIERVNFLISLRPVNYMWQK